MSDLQFRNSGYAFKPSWLGTLITLVCIPVFISLGQWQHQKAEAKQSLQSQLDGYKHEAPVEFPLQADDPETWRYRQVKVKGTYDTRYQILLDNQVEDNRVGYQVVTPLQIEGANLYVLVNRGWVPASANHSEIPLVSTPQGIQQIEGQVWIPTTKIYSLEKPEDQAGTAWQAVWQNMDMKRYRNSVPMAVSPLVIRLSPASAAGGFSRNWPAPAERIETHIGYAYQWYGFAVTAFIIYLVVSFRKPARNESDKNANAK
jgi:surfeit locus 1 family protein